MSKYHIPLADAHDRLGERMDFNSRTEHAGQLEEEARALALGRRVAAQVIVHALDNEPRERAIGRRNPWSGVVQAQHAGWVLCEYVTRTSRRNLDRYNLAGVLLARDSGVYGYRTDTAYGSKVKPDVNAWGRYALALDSGKDERPVPCKVIEAVNLMADPLDVDRQLGPYAGSLTLDDLFAGLIVRIPALSGRFGEEISLPGADLSAPDL